MNETRNESLGQVIRRRRAELGLTQEELAERVGPTVRQAEISRLENDRVTLPRRARLQTIADALELPLGMLLERSGWSGAEQIFNGDGEEHDHVPAPIERDALSPALPSWSHRGIEEHAHLRSELTRAISKSTMLLHETAAIMQQVHNSVLKLHQITVREIPTIPPARDPGNSGLQRGG